MEIQKTGYSTGKMWRLHNLQNYGNIFHWDELILEAIWFT